MNHGEPAKHLVILTGPVGAGKSTVARALAQWFRSHGLATAVIDLDLVYDMARQRDGYAEAHVWRTARLGSAALADSFFARGIDVVVVEGGLFGQPEHAELVEGLATKVVETFVTLLVAPEVALTRAQSDSSPDRVLSRRPEVQEALYAEFAAVLPFLRERSVVLNADDLSPQQLAPSIGSLVLERARTFSI